MTQVFTGNRHKLATFIPVHGGLGGFHIPRCARLDLDETEDIFVPPNEVDFPPVIWGTEIPSDHNVPVPSEIKIGILLAPSTSLQVVPLMLGRQGLAGNPVENSYGRVGEAGTEHG